MPAYSRRSRRSVSLAGLALVALVGAAALPAARQTQAKSAPPIEWIFGDEGRRVASVASTQWLSDGTLMLYDGRQPAAQRSFEILDPASGARRPALDMPAAVASVNALRPAREAMPVVGWPQSFDPSGRRGLYLFDGDLFVLDLPTARFTRVTRTQEQEGSAEFSPDGRRLAFVRANDLYVADLDAKTETRLTRDGSRTTLNGTLSWIYWEEIFGRRDIGFWWSPDSKALAYLQSDESSVPTSTFVDFQPETPRVITQHYPMAGQPNPKVRVGIVEVGGTSTTWVKITDRPFDWILRVKWLPDSRRVSVEAETRDQHEMGLYFADRATGAATRILTETDPAWINIHDDLHFLADGQHFLWASERDDYYHLYRYTMDGRLVNQVTRGPFALTSAGGLFWVRQSVTGIDADGWVYFMSMEHNPLERHLYRVKPDGSGMTRLSTEPGVHRITMPPAARFYTDNFSDARTMPALTIHKADGTLALTLAKPRPELLAGFDMQYPEILRIPARDGFQMPARLLKPKTLEPGHKYPVIMNVYGGASSAVVTDAWQSTLLYDQQLLAAGYAVLKVDNRTATATSKRIENTVYGHLGETETADFVDATTWLKQQPWVDPDRIGVWGWSNGGYMTLNLLTRSTAFKAGIAVAPVTDWRYYDNKWAEAFNGLPAEHPDFYDRSSVIPGAANLHGRLLIVYGTYDDNVHPQNEQAFMDALIKAGKLFEVMTYPMRKHDIGDRDATLHLYRTMLEFWKRSL
jgi:dipeptidyl-peptidase-4